MQTETGNVLAAGEHNPEGLGLVEEAVPPPMESGAPIKNPKNLGESLLNQIDPHQEILTFDQRRKVLSIREPEDVRRILLNDLGSAMTPNLESAEQIFSALAKLKIEIPSIVITWRIYTVAQCMAIIDEGRELLKDRTLTGKERRDAHASCVEAVKSLSNIIDKTQRIFERVGMLEKAKKSRAKVKVIQAPTRAAPEMG